MNGKIPTLEADSQKIAQVFSNLLDNSIKYTNNGGSITLTLSCVNPSSNGHNHEGVVVAVADTGIGIAREELPLVFDKYKDMLIGKSSLKRTTGLGLAICRNIIEAHNGTIGVESVPGEGSVFSVFLPAETM